MVTIIDTKETTGITTVEQTESATKDQIIEALTKIYKDQIGKVDKVKLLYLMKLTTNDLPNMEQKEINKTTIYYSQYFKSITCALVTLSPAQTVNAILYTDQESPKNIIRKVFTTEEAAHKWLTQID